MSNIEWINEKCESCSAWNLWLVIFGGRLLMERRSFKVEVLPEPDGGRLLQMKQLDS